MKNKSQLIFSFAVFSLSSSYKFLSLYVCVLESKIKSTTTTYDTKTVTNRKIIYDDDDVDTIFT